MLGLGSSITSGGGLVDDPTYFSYSAIGDVEPDPAITEYSVQGDMTITYGETAPDGTEGVIKVVYGDTEQTSDSGVQVQDIFASADASSGDTLHIRYSTYFEYDNTDPTWRLDLGQVKTTTTIGGSSKTRSQAINAWQTVDLDTNNNLTISNTSSNDFLIRFSTTGKFPRAGSTFYIRNISVSGRS